MRSGAGVARAARASDSIAALGGDHRVGDAGVAAGGVDEDLVLASAARGVRRRGSSPARPGPSRCRRGCTTRPWLDAHAGATGLGDTRWNDSSGVLPIRSSTDFPIEPRVAAPASSDESGSDEVGRRVTLKGSTAPANATEVEGAVQRRRYNRSHDADLSHARAPRFRRTGHITSAPAPDRKSRGS